MNRERVKSVILISLVILSFILTTRIWFDTSIEGIFIMNRNKPGKYDYNAEYDKSELLKPHKLIVSFGEKSTILYDNEQSRETYNRIFKEAKRVIRTAILVNPKDVVKKVPQEELDRIRNTRGISFIFNMSLEMDAVCQLMNISSSTDIGIGSIDEIIVSQSLNRIYFHDASQNELYELRTEGIQNNLDFIITSIEKLQTVSCLYLNRFQSELYGKNVVVPISIEAKGLPVLSGEKELAVGDEIPEDIAGLFKEDVSSLSIIKNLDGTLVYTDRENRVVKLYTNGMLEYVNYELQSSGSSNISTRAAIDISTEFVSKHFGFPENSRISDVIKSMRGDRYIIRYQYAYEGLPIILTSGLSNDSIEVEVVGNGVRRYKRLIRNITHELEHKQVLNFRNVLDIILDKKVEMLSGEKIKKINDMYLAYYERYSQSSITYIPVWVMDVTVERLNNGTVLNRRYIINAESWIILDK